MARRSWVQPLTLSAIAGLLGFRPTKAELHARAARNQYQRLRARYDAAQTTSDNSEHWLQADDLSGTAANSLPVRRTLRRRARYEVANNCYASGMLLTIANDLVGTGPRVQMKTADTEANKKIEQEFARWCREVKLAPKLRTAVVTKKRDGEIFFRFFSNPSHESPVWLDVELLEQDQVTTPTLVPTEFVIDGITFDQYQNPYSYQILRQHPGEQVAIRTWLPDNVPASQVIHWFRVDRPGQRRGVPEITPALPLFAQLRRFTLSVITAAETAADHAAVLESTAAANAEDTDGDIGALSPFDDVAYTRGMLTAVPFGWKLSQLRAEQPTTTYGMFKQEILNEIARCIHVPYNVAAGNSAGYNYSSGRLDHKGYYGAIGIEQSECELVVLDRIFRAWYAEARLITLADGSRYVPDVDLCLHPYAWAWDPPADIDPVKTATAQSIGLANGTVTFAEIFGEKGVEMAVSLQEQADALGITKEEYQALLRQKIFGAVLSQAPDPSVSARRKKKKRSWLPKRMFGGARV
ncbi:MAG: phage portal protein [Schlesneria sp.]